MKRTTVALVLAVCLSSLAAVAQDAGGDRGERSRRRDGGPQGGPGAEGQRPMVMPIIAALDANGDGVIDADEIAKASAALKRLDKSGDGKLTVDEYRPQPPGGPGGFGGPDGPRMGGPGGREGGTRGGPGGPPGEGAAQTGFESSPLAKDDAEKKILGVLETMNQNQRGMMSVPRDDGRFLRMLTESVGPKNVVELGTSHGYSAIWQCLALRSTGGKLTTFEIDAQRAGLAKENFKRAGVESIVTLVQGDAHKEVARLKDPIDLLFLDADKEGYLDYLEKLLPLVRPGGLIVAHNMNARQADPRYIKAITTNPALETLFVNLGNSGIGVTLKKR